MKFLTPIIILVFSFLFVSNVFAGRIKINHISLNLEKIETENLGIIIWDQREMVSDRSQPESFLGYVRSITGIAYGHITKSKTSLVSILESKIAQAYESVNSKVAFVSMSPYENEGDLIHRIKNSSFDKILVLRLNNFIFDGVVKVEFVMDVETLIYNKKGELLYQNNVNNKTPMGSSGKVNKTVPSNIKSSIEKILNNSALHSELNKNISSNVSAEKLDVIISKEGEEIEGRIIEITDTTIKYKSASQLEGPVRNISTEKVFMIKYGDGTKEVMSKSE